MPNQSILAKLTNLRKLDLFNIIAAGLLIIIALALAFQLIPATSFIPIVGSSLLSTFLGASFAFHLNTEKDAKKEQERRVAALQPALFILGQQYNALGGSWSILSKWQFREDRWINMPAMREPTHDGLKQDFSSLAFILNDNAQLLMDLSIEEDRFHACYRALTERVNFYVEEFHDAVEQVAKGRKKIETNELIDSLGARLSIGAKSRTNDVFMHVSESLKSVPSIATKLREYSKEHYPNEKFIRIELYEEKQDA